MSDSGVAVDTPQCSYNLSLVPPTPRVTHIQGAPIKNNPIEKCYISATVVRIWAKLSDFVCEYSHNTQCKLY